MKSLWKICKKRTILFVSSTEVKKILKVHQLWSKFMVAQSIYIAADGQSYKLFRVAALLYYIALNVELEYWNQQKY